MIGVSLIGKSFSPHDIAAPAIEDESRIDAVVTADFTFFPSDCKDIPFAQKIPCHI